MITSVEEVGNPPHQLAPLFQLVSAVPNHVPVVQVTADKLNTPVDDGLAIKWLSSTFAGTGEAVLLPQVPTACTAPLNARLTAVELKDRRSAFAPPEISSVLPTANAPGKVLVPDPERVKS